MRTGRQVRVLMLGWEYPPRFAGGLGKACQGLSQAMAKQGAQVFFVLPTYPEKKTEDRLEVVGAREALLEAGWILDVEGGERAERRRPGGSRRGSSAQTGEAAEKGEVTYLRSGAKLSPYAGASEPMPENLIRFVKNTAEIDARKLDIESPRRAGARARAKVLRGTAARVGAASRGSSMSGSGAEIYGRNLWNEIERFAFTVRHMAESHEVDVVHAHDWMTFPAAFEFQKVSKVPVFLHVHATEYDRSGENLNNDVFRIEREGFRRATHLFAVSRYTAGIIERLYGVPKKKITVVYNAPEESSRQMLARPEAPRKPQVVFLGRLTFQKGPDHFLKAAALVAQANPEARFIFCGSGDMLDKLRAQAHRLGIEASVHFAGFVDPSGVDQILQHSKVLVMPSVSEPFGLVALEAIHNGIPVIISKQSGVREVLHRALQVDFWDHEKLADQILAALRLGGLSKQLVDDGMDQLQQLSWDKSASVVIDVYKRYLGTTYAQMVGGAHGH